MEADVVIIDEMSMVDIQLFQALLKATLPGTRLILVGDVDQLPSVGPGQVLRDLMNSKAFPMVTLEKIFRQAGQSDIVVNAHRINKGEQIALDNKSKDFFLLERSDVNVIYKHMIQLIQDKLPRYANATPFDIQVLTPMRKGSLGCETLNGILQRYLNPADPCKKEHACGNAVFREGDKVMQIKNNYQLEWEIVGRYNIPIDKGLGVFNGDMGRIREIKKQVRHKEWAAMVSDCQASGKKVEEWCAENSINVSTYYKRLNVLRSELIDDAEKQSIVPVSVSTAIANETDTVIPNAARSSEDKIIMRKDGIEITLPKSISEDTIFVLLKGLKQC